MASLGLAGLSYKQQGNNLNCLVGYENADGTGFFQTDITIPLLSLPNTQPALGAYLKANVPTLFDTFCTNNGATPPAGYIWVSDPEAAGSAARSFSNAPARSIVTGTGATGFQVSSTRDAQVSYSGTIVTTATLASGAVGTLVLEICPTNSSTAGNWIEVARLTNGQVFSLAVAIGCTQTISSTLSAVVPAAYYAKVRSINTTGTPTFSISSQQEVLL